MPLAAGTYAQICKSSLDFSLQIFLPHPKIIFQQKNQAPQATDRAAIYNPLAHSDLRASLGLCNPNRGGSHRRAPAPPAPSGHFARNLGEATRSEGSAPGLGSGLGPGTGRARRGGHSASPHADAEEGPGRRRGAPRGRCRAVSSASPSPGRGGEPGRPSTAAGGERPPAQAGRAGAADGAGSHAEPREGLPTAPPVAFSFHRFLWLRECSNVDGHLVARGWGVSSRSGEATGGTCCRGAPRRARPPSAVAARAASTRGRRAARPGQDSPQPRGGCGQEEGTNSPSRCRTSAA